MLFFPYALEYKIYSLKLYHIKHLHIHTCFRFYTQKRVEKKKHLHIEFIVTSHNSVDIAQFCWLESKNCAKHQMSNRLGLIKHGTKNSFISLIALSRYDRGISDCIIQCAMKNFGSKLFMLGF